MNGFQIFADNVSWRLKIRCPAFGSVMLAILLPMCGGGLAFAQMSESFEYGVPPPGWTKTNLLGGSGWYQLPIGVMPLPGWGNGTSSVPATANAGTHNAYCSWTTGGGAAEGYHSDQWLISPRLTGLTATSTVSYWLRFNFTNFPDTVYFRVSTNGPAPANFTIVALTNIFARASYTNQFPPWSNHVVNVGALGIPAGTPIWIAIQEYEWDNTWNESALQLDVINSDLTAPPEARTSPTSLVFTAYYEGADPAPQTFALQAVGSSGMGFACGQVFGAGPTNWLTVGGPASGTLGFQGSQVYTAAVSAAGLDLGTYVATNVFNVPGATNSPLRVPITFNVIRRPQAISFPNPGPQHTTNQVGLAGTSSSGLPVTFSVFSGPGSIVGATNLSFTGTGTVRVVAWQLGNVYYDVAPCVTQAMAVTKPAAAILFTNLSHVYDGAPHGATVTTVPAGLTVDTTYNGSASLPVAIGSYAVTSTVNDVLYGGTATATFTITRMVQTVDFPDPGPQWTTSAVGLAATASSGLPVAFSVASGPGTISGGTNLSFTGAGTVSVVATQAGDADWLPAAATNSIAVAKVAATVALGNLTHAYDGTAKSATATTDPAGLSVDFTYNGSGTVPANAGSYAVTGTINDAFYQGSAAGTLSISKADQAITFPELRPRLINEVVELGATASSGLPVTEYEVASGPGEIAGTNLAFTAAGDVVIVARQSGDGNWNPAPAVTNAIKGFSVSPGGGPVEGGNIVLISNGRIGDGASVTNVALCGVPATILGQGTDWVEVRCGPGAAGRGDVVIESDVSIVVSNGYAYNPPGSLVEVAPASGSFAGGYPVAIIGTNLCDGSDATNVTICGVAVQSIDSQSPTQIVVVAGAAGGIGPGDVRVFSASFGETVGSNAFEYVRAEQSTLAFAPASPQAYGTTNALSISGGLGTGAVSYAVLSGPGVIVDGSNLAVTAGSGSIEVRATQGEDALHFAGSVTAIVEAAKAGQSIEDFLPPDGMQFPVDSRTSLSARASSGLEVVFAVGGGSAAITGGTNLEFTGTGTVSIVASQAGDADRNPVAVTNSYRIFLAPAGPPVLSRNQVNVREAGEGRFYVRLDRVPAGAVTVVVSRISGDTDITLKSGAARVFTAANWDTWQMVTLGAASDADAAGGTAMFQVATPWYSREVEAAELDDDIGTNQALAARGSTISGFLAGRPEQLIDGLHTSSANYGYVVWTNLASPGTMTLDLKATTTVSRVRLLNWDWDCRQYRYRIETSLDGAAWTDLVDATAEEHAGWEDWAVADREARYLRFTGVSNSANQWVHLAEWEVYGSRPALQAVLDRASVNVRENGEGRFFVKLNQPPAGSAVVGVGRIAGAANLAVKSGGTLTFTSANWDTWQMVTLGAANDADAAGGTATFQIFVGGVAAQTVEAAELDDDIGTNQALASRGSTISGFLAGRPEQLIDGLHTSSANYGYVVWTNLASPGTMTLDLKATTTVSRVRLLNWDWDCRQYRYRIETSLDGAAWTDLVDATAEEHAGWEDWAVADREARYLRFTGVSNSANQWVHLAEWEVFGTRVAVRRSSSAAKAGISDAEPLPVVVATSDDEAGHENGWTAVDGDPETVWEGAAGAGSWHIAIGYASPIQVDDVEVQLAEGSLTHIQFMYSMDAESWSPLPDDPADPPVWLNYLWLLFPSDGTASVPRVREIRPIP